MRKQLVSFAQVMKFCKTSSSKGVLTPTPYALGRPMAWILVLELLSCLSFAS